MKIAILDRWCRRLLWGIAGSQRPGGDLYRPGGPSGGHLGWGRHGAWPCPPMWWKRPCGWPRVLRGAYPQTRPSLLVDLEAGRRLELEAMSGTVVRYGQEAGVPTPVHGVIYASLKACKF